MDKAAQGQYYDMALGPYDIWAVEFGYKPFDSDSEREEILSFEGVKALKININILRL